jgi:hypothetical protein
MSKLNNAYNVLNLPNIDYEKANSGPSTVSLVHASRELKDKGLSIEEIAKKIGRSLGRTKELITGVNKIAHSKVYKKISGVD